MSEKFSQEILTKVVAQICQIIGFDRIMSSALDVLVEILRKFILDLGKVTQQYAEHCERSEVHLSDLYLAFHDRGINLTELLDFLHNVPLPRAISVPKYPVPVDNQNSYQEFLVKLHENDLEVPKREHVKITISLSKIKKANEAKKAKSRLKKKRKENEEKVNTE